MVAQADAQKSSAADDGVVEMGDLIVTTLFLGFFVYLFVTLLCEALQAQGRGVPRWLPLVLIVAIMLAFMSVFLNPVDVVKKFWRFGVEQGGLPCETTRTF